MQEAYRPGQGPGIPLARHGGDADHSSCVVSFTDAVVIVTGGSRGPGRDVARALAGRAFVVVVVYLDDQSEAETAVDEILAANGTALSVRADVTDELDVERLFTETAAAFGGVDVIVHADLRGSWVVNRQAASQLRHGGVIVNVTGSDAMTPAIADELRARGITITGISPGFEPAGDHPDIAYYVSILDRWRRRPGD